jgi:hypothetical protein
MEVRVVKDAKEGGVRERTGRNGGGRRPQKKKGKEE